jgi:hypothetical protein
MTAIACLRIAVGEDLRFADDEAMAAMVAKIAGAYLETTWTWPRRFGLVAPFAFVLADPRAERLDARELQRLAADLQRKLFGEGEGGDVCLLMIEGAQAEVMRFAGAHLGDLEPLLQGRDDGAFRGRICRVTPTTVESLAPPGGPVGGLPPGVAAAEVKNRSARTGWWGIYYLPKAMFLGGSVAVRPDPVRRRGAQAADLEDDVAGIEAARQAMSSHAQGVMFLSFSFSSIVRASTRAVLKSELTALPGAQRPRLAATIRDVPRAPAHQALVAIQDLLKPHVAYLDLRTSDPLFRVEALTTGAFTSVTLALSGADDRARLSAIKAFAGERRFYQSRRIWQGVSDLSSPTELEFCRARQVPFLSGPMISSLMTGPISRVACAPDSLPYRPAG